MWIEYTQNSFERPKIVEINPEPDKSKTERYNDNSKEVFENQR